jgi:hypothetical protein
MQREYDAAAQANVDECFRRIVGRLRDMGHDVVTGVDPNSVISLDRFNGENSHHPLNGDWPLLAWGSSFS